jgi:hypothetical protein
MRSDGSRRPSADRADGRGGHRRSRVGEARRRDDVGEAPSSDEGSATAELAASLPALVLLLVAALGALGVVRDQIECVDAAREVALAASRGEAAPSVQGAVTITHDGDLVRATVSRHRSMLGGLAGITVVGSSVAAMEPS